MYLGELYLEERFYKCINVFERKIDQKLIKSIISMSIGIDMISL